MTEIQISKQANKIYDLEERTFNFAKQIGVLNKEILPKTVENNEYLEFI